MFVNKVCRFISLCQYKNTQPHILTAEKYRVPMNPYKFFWKNWSMRS